MTTPSAVLFFLAPHAVLVWFTAQTVLLACGHTLGFDSRPTLLKFCWSNRLRASAFPSPCGACERRSAICIMTPPRALCRLLIRRVPGVVTAARPCRGSFCVSTSALAQSLRYGPMAGIGDRS